MEDVTSDDETFFLFLNWGAVPKKSTPAKFAYIRHFQEIGINVTKFEKTLIHFKSDVFAALTVVDAKLPIIVCCSWMPIADLYHVCFFNLIVV